MKKATTKKMKKATTKKTTEKFVIIRSFNAGVFAGNLVEQDNAHQRVVLKNAIRLWYWDGAFTLSQLAMEGVSKPQNCKFSIPVLEQEIYQVIEIIPTTDVAEKSVKGVEPCRK
jgi:hypothetical protein